MRPGSSRGNGSAGEDAKTYPLHLVSSQPRDRLHSQMDCGPVSAGGKVAGREAIAINPADAKARGIGDGDVVRVYNSRGACLAGAIVSDIDQRRRGAGCPAAPGTIRPTTASSALCRHGNANVLTRDQGTSKLAQGPSSATALVEVERWTGPLEPVAAFDPPRVDCSSFKDGNTKHPPSLPSLVELARESKSIPARQTALILPAPRSSRASS